MSCQELVLVWSREAEGSPLAVFSCVTGGRRGWRCTVKGQVVPWKNSVQLPIRKHFSMKLVKALKHVAQTGCGIFSLGDAQNSTGHSPEQPDLNVK